MISRRRFVQSSMAMALVPLLPKMSSASTGSTVAVRQNWVDFAKGPYLQAFIDAIGKMRANPDDTDPNSWFYWVKVHEANCPHRRPYFLAWHRGLLKRFEGRLQRICGISDLTLPYWDYYTSPKVPPEFLVEHTPLWRNKRTSDDVTNALSLAPFADNIVNFPRGETDAFEPSLESAPHNPVHNIIGGAMSNVLYSPADPLFWVHHANIDRLWAAWANAGNGRQMPPTSDTYWQSQTLQYGPAIRTMPAVWTYDTTSTYLDYTYDDESMPQTLPATTTQAMLRPASQPVATLAPAATSAGSSSLGGAGQFALDEHSVTFDIPLGTQSANQVRSVMLNPTPAPSGPIPTTLAAAEAAERSPLDVVLEGVRLTEVGLEGGYFYKVFVNLPEAGQPVRQERDYLLGLIGPFEITAAQMRMRMDMGLPMDGSGDAKAHKPMHPTMRFPATEALKRIWPVTLGKLSVSFVRVSGNRHRPGRTILVDRLHLEASNAR